MEVPVGTTNVPCDHDCNLEKEETARPQAFAPLSAPTAFPWKETIVPAPSFPKSASFLPSFSLSLYPLLVSLCVFVFASLSIYSIAQLLFSLKKKIIYFIYLAF